MVEIQVQHPGRRRRSSNISSSLLTRLHVEKVEGGLSIAGCALAANCHLVLLVFAFFFLLAGAVLTALAYRPSSQDEDEPKEKLLGLGARRRMHEQTRVVGPIFLLLGLAMLTFGAVLCGLAWKVSKAERERRMPLHLQGAPRDSSYRILPSIAHSVPIGLFIDTASSLPPIKEHGATHTCLGHTRELLDTKDELICTTPVPIIASPVVFRDQLFRALGPITLSSSSDQPFGSILSLTGAGNGDVASFPSASALETSLECREQEICEEEQQEQPKTPGILPIIHVAEFTPSTNMPLEIELVGVTAEPPLSPICSEEEDQQSMSSKRIDETQPSLNDT